MVEFSVQVPFMPTRAEQVVPFAALVQRTRAERLWLGQAKYVEQHQVFAYLVGLGIRVPAGFGVTVMPLRHPLEAAIQARSVAVVTNQPVVAGFGPGAVALQDSLLGRRYGSQLTAVREFATLVRAFLDGEPVAQDGDYFSFHGDLTPTPAPRVDLGLGVLRPAMARVAGEVADVAITWLTPASYLRNQIVPALRAADRRPRLVATVPLALRQPDRDPAQLADTVHLRVPHYVDMLRKAGVDTSDVARAAVDAGAFVYGDPDEIAKQLTEFAEAGVDEIVLSVTGVCLRHGPKAALAELEAILSAVLP